LEAEAFITTIAHPTIKNRFVQLVELGLLERKGKGAEFGILRLIIKSHILYTPSQAAAVILNGPTNGRQA